MTIVSSSDSRNAGWASNSVGSRLLLKMGWSEGEGLGRRNQGNAQHLRALRRSDDTLGIGATTDTTGTNGWHQTNHSFTDVLRGLQEEHGGKKKVKKKKKKLTLAKNLVTAGHARRMRDAKDLSKKSDQDMAAIFGGQIPSQQTSSKKDKKEKKRKRDTGESDAAAAAAAVATKSEERTEEVLEEAESKSTIVDDCNEIPSPAKLKKEKRSKKKKKKKSKADKEEEKPKKKKRKKDV